MKGRIYKVVTCAAAYIAAAPLYAQWTVASEATVITTINSIRAQMRTCPGGNQFAATSPLKANAKLTSAAANFSPNGYLGPFAQAGYLAFRGDFLMSNDGNIPGYAAPDVNDLKLANGSVLPAVQTYWLGDRRSCEALMDPNYTEAGVSVSAPPNVFPTLTLVLGAPYNPANAFDYKVRMFNQLNKIRATGIDGSKYPGAKCTSGPVPAVQWNDKVAQAAQFHSDDFANKGVYVVNGSPHNGTAGDMVGNRLTAAGCPLGGSENVNFNFGKSPEEAVLSWITLSQAHCGGLVNPQNKVSGFGIAASAALQTAGSGPFVTLDQLLSDEGCSDATKTSPSGNVPIETPAGDKISSGTTNGFLEQNQKLRSANGQYELVMQSDGHLCIYKNGQFVWGNGSYRKGAPPYKLAMQADSNLVVYGSSGAIWASGVRSNGMAPYTVRMQDDGNLAIYDSTGRHVWDRINSK